MKSIDELAANLNFTTAKTGEDRRSRSCPIRRGRNAATR